MKTFKYLIAICVLQFAVFVPLWAQVGNIKQKINDIKLNASYVFGESENKEEMQAYEIAIRDLLYSINLIRKDKGLTPLDQNNLEQKLQKMSYQRGELFCVFIYVKKSDIISTQGKINPENNRQEEQISVTNPSEVNTVDDSFRLDILRNVLEREMIVNVWQYLTKMKESGKIANLGKPRSLAEIPGSAYVIIFDKTFRVVSILTPYENGIRMNVCEEKPDTISKYSGHGVVWYKF